MNSNAMESLDFAGEIRKGISARPMRECAYPRCMECPYYVVHSNEKFCTVPMVISKQLFFDLTEKLDWLENTIKDLENALYDEILGVNKGYHIEHHDGIDYYVPDRPKIITENLNKDGKSNFHDWDEEDRMHNPLSIDGREG